ncbi:MAG: hypothetical protein RB191_19350 [Terriglobia bacterium]|nr:hypothetical protein [Terriglobia bacterium]
MAVEHQIVSGKIPQDGDEILKALDEASADGYILSQTTSCAIDEANAYYIATMVKPVVDSGPARPSSIGLSGGGSKQKEPPNVNSSPPAQSTNP